MTQRDLVPMWGVVHTSQHRNRTGVYSYISLNSEYCEPALRVTQS